MPPNAGHNYDAPAGGGHGQENQQQTLELQKELRQYGIRTVIESVIGIVAMITAIVVCYFMDRNNKWGVDLPKKGAPAAAVDEATDPRASVQIRFYALAPVVTGTLVLIEGLVLLHLSKKAGTLQKGAGGHLPQLVQALHVLRVFLAVTLFAVLIGTILESSGQPHCSLGLAMLTAICLGVWFTTLRTVIKNVEREVKFAVATNGMAVADEEGEGDPEA